jgi:translation initiation factor 2B subunit (eIF-2B alpha/beta/delta family)
MPEGDQAPEEDIPQLLQRLQADNTSGATALVELALDILAAFARPTVTPQPHDFGSALEALVGAVLAAQPSMAVLITLAQQALQACPDGLPPATARQQLQQALAAFRRHVRESTEALCQQVITILPPRSTVLTYSHSATVIAALRYAHSHGHVRRVLLSESRPAYDGRPQARALLEYGIAVEYSIDIALLERLPEADVVLVGADAVFPDRLINKLGTHALAQLAHLQGVPCFSLSTSSKFLPAPAAALLRIVDHAGAEVWPEAPGGLRLSNRYFDATPLGLLSGIVSERGLSTPDALRRLLLQQELAPVLQRLASGRASSQHQRELATDRPPLEQFEQR